MGDPMLKQLSLPGFEGPRKATIQPRPWRPPDVKHGVFFAHFPESDAAVRAYSVAQGLCRKYGLLRQPLAADRLHVSLAGFGEFPRVPPKLVRLLSDAASAVAVNAFDVSFDRVMTFGNRSDGRKRPTVLLCRDGSAELIDLQKCLNAALAGVGLVRTSAFVPHVTLLYDHATISEHAIDPVRWTVREFHLIDSLHGLTKHIRIGRWALEEKNQQSNMNSRL